MICQTVLLVNVTILANHLIMTVHMNINNMVKWSSNLSLYFNTNKCNVLHNREKNRNCDYFMSIG